MLLLIETSELANELECVTVMDSTVLEIAQNTWVRSLQSHMVLSHNKGTPI